MTRWLLPILLTACGTAEPPPTPADRLPWLVGTWQQVDGDATIVERWTATPDGTLLGGSHVRIGPQVLGYTESLAITPGDDGGLVLTTWPVEQPPGTFDITLEGTGGLVATRRGDGFPARLTFTIEADDAPPVLTVRAEGPGPQGATRSETMTLSAVAAGEPPATAP